jgi:hypothetical protein
VSFCSEIDEFSESVVLAPLPRKSEASHTRTASDYDSVILMDMGRDETDKENFDLEQICDMIDFQNAPCKGFVITPGRIDFAKHRDTTAATHDTLPPIQEVDHHAPKPIENDQSFKYE